MAFLLPSIAVVAGLSLLVWSADLIVDSARLIAIRLGLPMLIVGVMLVGFGTSAPEMIVSAIASLRGNPGLAIGNAVGSNIANIGLVLGVSAMIAPAVIPTRTLRCELPLVIGTTLIAAYLMLDGQLTITDGLILLVLFVAVLVLLLKMHQKTPTSVVSDDNNLDTKRLFARFFFGVAIVVISARALVWGASDIAKLLGLSDTIIGLTILAIGTSLPELSTSVAAVLRKQGDLSIGNILGSNLFNLLIVLPIPAFITATTIGRDFFSRDVATMGAFTVLLTAFILLNRPMWMVSRYQGALLLSGFCSYTALLAFDSFA